MIKHVVSTAAALCAAAILAGGALAPAAMARPDPKPQSNQASPQSDKGSMQKIYCVVEVPTGSRVRVKDCRTRAAWIAASGVDPAEEARK